MELTSATFIIMFMFGMFILALLSFILALLTYSDKKK